MITERRLKLAGHLWRSKKELASKILFLESSSLGEDQSADPHTYIDQLADDTGLRIEDIPAAMLDHLGWRERIKRNQDFST